MPMGSSACIGTSAMRVACRVRTASIWASSNAARCFNRGDEVGAADRLLLINQAHGSIPARRSSSCKWAASNTGVVSAKVTIIIFVRSESCNRIIGVV